MIKDLKTLNLLIGKLYQLENEVLSDFKTNYWSLNAYFINNRKLPTFYFASNFNVVYSICILLELIIQLVSSIKNDLQLILCFEIMSSAIIKKKKKGFQCIVFKRIK